MEVLDCIEPEIQTSHAENDRNNKSRFEELLANSISSDEFWGDVHKHIDEWYDARKLP
jgi:hypothetical protein